jgi:excisionase family DNA binding protein
MKPLVTLGRISTTLALLKPAYSVETFCLAFDIGRSTIYEEIRSGRLKAHKVGTRTIIALEDGLAWLHDLPVVETMNPPFRPRGFPWSLHTSTPSLMAPSGKGRQRPPYDRHDTRYQPFARSRHDHVSKAGESLIGTPGILPLISQALHW